MDDGDGANTNPYIGFALRSSASIYADVVVSNLLTRHHTAILCHLSDLQDLLCAAVEQNRVEMATELLKDAGMCVNMWRERLIYVERRERLI